MEHSYREVYDSASNLGRALVKRGLFFVEPERGMRLVGIYARNRYEWFVTDWACIQFGLTSVPLYDTLGVDNLSYCLRQT
jgi:long-chain acyl-CoA synthetase